MKISALAPMMLALVSLNAFSQDSFPTSKIINKTYPNRSLVFKCLDADCESIDAILMEGTTEIKTKVLYKSELETQANKKLTRQFSIQQGSRLPYDLSDEVAVDVGSEWREGYEMKAVGDAAIMGLAFAYDTLILPVTITNYFYYGHVEGKEDKATAKDSLKVIRKSSSIELKEREFSQTVKSLNI